MQIMAYWWNAIFYFLIYAFEIRRPASFKLLYFTFYYWTLRLLKNKVDKRNEFKEYRLSSRVRQDKLNTMRRFWANRLYILSDDLQRFFHKFKKFLESINPFFNCVEYVHYINGVHLYCVHSTCLDCILALHKCIKLEHCFYYKCINIIIDVFLSFWFGLIVNQEALFWTNLHVQIWVPSQILLWAIKSIIKSP